MQACKINTLKDALSQLQDGKVMVLPIPNQTSPPIPVMPTLRKAMSMRQKLESIQKFINSFEYNHIGRETTLSFPRKDRGMKHIINMAKCIIRDALPIQCVEAVFLAVYLTHEMNEVCNFISISFQQPNYKLKHLCSYIEHKLLRIPVSFRSRVDDEEHSHMVLAVKYTPSRKQLSSNNIMEAWGALGLSRLKKLMYKPLMYHSLSELIADYTLSYQQYYHELQEVSLGHPFSHGLSDKTHLWKAITISSNEGQPPLLHSETAGIWTNNHVETLTRFAKICTKVSECLNITECVDIIIIRL
jgi:hypothetical protein